MTEDAADTTPPRPDADRMTAASDGGTPAGSTASAPAPRRTHTTTRRFKTKRYGSVHRDQFTGTLAVSAVFLAIIVSMGLLTGPALGSIYGGGTGGFVAEFGTVEAGEGTIFPVIDEHPACENLPQLKAVIDGDVEIGDHVRFYKDLPTPGDFTDADIVRLAIESEIPDGELAFVNDLDLRMTALEAEYIELGEEGGEPVVLREFGPDTWEGTSGEGDEHDRFSQAREVGFDDADYEFGLGAEGDDNFFIDRGVAVAHSVAVSELSLPDLQTAILIGAEDDFDAPDPRVVDSDDACEDLAE